MKLGILKRHRNLLFQLLKESKLEVGLFDSDYNASENEFSIFIKGHDFKFHITRSDDNMDFFETVEGDSIREEESIDVDGDIDDVVSYFQEWIDGSVKEYLMLLEEERTLPDYWATINDPITQKYQEEFYTDYEIIDDNADTEPFNLEQQLFLDSYLDNVIIKINEFKTKENKVLVEEIKKEAKNLKEEIPQLTKKETVKKLSTIWAKMRKASLTILKEFYLVAKHEIISAIVKGMIDGLPL